MGHARKIYKGIVNFLLNRRKESEEETKPKPKPAKESFEGAVSTKEVKELLVDAIVAKRKPEQSPINTPATHMAFDDNAVDVLPVVKKTNGKSIKLNTISLDADTAVEKYEQLRNKGSHQYSLGEKLLCVRAVAILLVDWFECIEYTVNQYSNDDDSSTWDDASNDVLKVIGVHDAICDIFTPTLGKACIAVAPRLGVDLYNLKQWTAEFYSCGTITEPISKRRTALIFQDGALAPEYILECLEYLSHNNQRGLRTNYNSLVAHLRSEVRHHALLSVELCPPLVISVASLRRALYRSGGIGWGKVNSVGKIQAYTEADLQRRRARLRVFWVEYDAAMRREKAGNALLVQMDESFVNLFHFAGYGLAELDENGKTIGDIQASKGKGPRLCLVGAISRFGPLVVHDQHGEFVRDHRWQNAKGESTRTHGRFVELSDVGEPRACFIPAAKGISYTPSGLNSLKLDDLKAKASELNIQLPAGVRHTKKLIIDAILVHVSSHPPSAPSAIEAPIATPPASRAASRKKESLEQLVMMDFPRKEMEYGDQALTTFKVFPANCGNCGDYHLNFVTETFFKWFCALLKVYPAYCKQVQDKIDACTIPVPVGGPLYDRENERPTRTMILSMDNAPYHKGVMVQLSGQSKEQMAHICRLRGIQSIKYAEVDQDTGQVVDYNFEVPAPGQPWGPVGNPSVEQVRAGTLRALRQVARELVEPPFLYLIRQLEGKWGPPGAPAVELIWNAPMVSDQIAIELIWADSKNAVAKAHHQREDRTLADISEQLHERWFDNFHTKSANLFKHAEKIMSQAIAVDASTHKGPLSGAIGELKGLPNAAELAEWREMAGMKDDYVSDDEEEGDDDEDDDEDDDASD